MICKRYAWCLSSCWFPLLSVKCNRRARVGTRRPSRRMPTRQFWLQRTGRPVGGKLKVDQVVGGDSVNAGIASDEDNTVP